MGAEKFYVTKRTELDPSKLDPVNVGLLLA